MSSSQVSAFHPLPFNGGQATTDLYNGCALGINNAVFWGFFFFGFFQVLSLFLKTEIDFFFFSKGHDTEVWKGFGSGKSITDTEKFIKPDGLALEGQDSGGERRAPDSRRGPKLLRNKGWSWGVSGGQE